MGLYNSPAIVLRSINLSETDKLVTFMTHRFGKVKCVAKGARKIKSRSHAALLPLSHLNLIYFGKEQQTLYRLSHSDIVESFQDLREDFDKLYTAVYFAELVDAMVPEADREPGIFDLLLDSLTALKQDTGRHPLLSMFELRLLAHAGYRPELGKCVYCRTAAQNGWMGFTFQHRGIVCDPCSRRHAFDLRVGAGTLSYLKKLQTLDIRWSARLKFPKGLEEEIDQVSHRLILAQVGRELKSYPFIKAMANVG
jgi:DNA repair protein RecO (recombination protein O)